MMRPDDNLGVFTTDARLVIRSWDAWLAQATQIPPAIAIGQALPALIPDLEARRLLERFRRAVDHGTVEVLAPAFHHYLIPCPPRTPSSRFTQMQQRVTIAPLREDMRVIGVIVTIEDVTARLDREQDLADALRSPDEGTRLRAAEALAHEADSPAALLDALGDASWRVRRAAADSLITRASDHTVTELLRTLRSQHDNLSVLNSALQVLAMSDVDTMTPLIALLSDTDTTLRMYAALALGQQRERRAIGPLVAALQDPDINVRYHAIEALGQLRAAEAVNELAAILDPADFFLTFPALDALVRIGEPAVADRIAPLLDHELLAAPAAEALGQLGDEAVVAPLARALNLGLAPAAVVARALASLSDRYQAAYREGAHIADLARQTILPAGMKALLDALPEANPEDLRSLALVLGWLEGAAVERALTRLLGQPSARKEVIEALVQHGARVIALLIEQLDAPDLETRQAAAIALGRIGDVGAVPALMRTLSDSPELAIVTAGALAKIGDRRAFDALLALMGHEDASVRQAIVSALNSLGHPDMAGHMVSRLQDPNPLVRESAVKIAGYFGYAECVELLLAACADPHPNVSRAALEHIPYLDDARVFDALLDGLRRPNATVRAAAARGLAQVEGTAALQPLLAALEDRDAWVRYYAARALGRHAFPDALAALAQLAQGDPAHHVRAAAIEALGRVGGARVVSILAPLAEVADRDLARAALGALGVVGHPDALPPLLNALRSPLPGRQLDAVRALAERGGAGAAGALQWAAASDANPAVMLAAIEALARLATPEALAALVSLTADATRREACVAALAQTGEAHADQIARGLEHAQIGVRCAVVDALARMKRPYASELLATALDDPEAVVRLAAVQALTRLGSRRAERQLAVLARSDADLEVRRAAQVALQRRT
jgi:HEAT repeat protein